MFKIGWTKTQAKLVAHTKVKDAWVNRENGPSFKVETWDHMVELPGLDGEPTRLIIRLKGGGFDLPKLGSTVSVEVNKDRTKAAFDDDDPRISLKARMKLGKKRDKRKEAEKRAKFEAKLNQRD